MDGQAVFQLMHRIGVTQTVDTADLVHAALHFGATEDPLRAIDAKWRGWVTRTGEEPVGRTVNCPIATQLGEQAGREHNQAILSSFALLDAQQTALAIKVADPQPNHLAHPQAAAVTGLQ